MKKRDLIIRLEKAIARLEAFTENSHELHDKNIAEAVAVKRADMLQVMRVWRERQEGYASAHNVAHAEHVYAATLLQRLEEAE